MHPIEPTWKDLIDPRIARYIKQERPLLDELASIGIHLQSVWDLNDTDQQYPNAIPILLAHMNGDYSPFSKTGIVEAVCKKWARTLVWEQIVEAYETESNLEDRAPPGEIGSPAGPKSAMANGLVEMATASDMEKMIELIENPQNGSSRILLTTYFSRSRQQRAFDTLARLSNDPDLKVEIAYILKTKLRRAAKKKGPSATKH